MSRWIDITRPMDETLVTWPGRARPLLRWEKRIATGNPCNVSFWQLSAHSGTHMDAPLHFIAEGKSIEQIAPEVFLGECKVIDLTSTSAPMDENTARRSAGARRLIVKTGHSKLHPDGRYEPHDALLNEQASSALLDGGLILIGTDRLSVDDSRGESFRLHHLFLGAGCVIVEGLDLAEVEEGSHDLFAAPLRFSGAEASPIRALLKARNNR